MRVADVILETDFGAEFVTAALFVGPASEADAGQVDRAADKAEAFVSGTDVGVEIGLFGKPLDASCVRTLNVLPIFKGLASMMHLHMSLQAPARGRDEVAKHAVLMLLSNMVQKQSFRGEAHALLGSINKC